MKRRGFAKEFEMSFLPKEEGRKQFFEAIKNPEFVKATNELMSLFMPHGMGCKRCQEVVKTEQLTRYSNMAKEERWLREESIDYFCHHCDHYGTKYTNSIWIHIKICEECHRNE